MALSKETKEEIFKEYGGSVSNTGSPEAQVALLTARINHISDHLKGQKKDNHSRRSLIQMVGRRKKFLKYIASKDIEAYRALIKKLGIRK